ncbi:hypothetical protein PRZ48_013473 [Zasmidium cellare]|uniref:Uncharacterized protein n=1 Tax=Zasmidium cellare TaxID=395010 RepID=A0ABR0E1R8_ZASCE|nr:hypothetical protein PRZ48_013473 [Zasmidium cellare]
MQFTTTLLTLLAATSALAAPVDTNTSVQPRQVAPEQSTCKAYRNDMININQSVFVVTIGRPYLGGGRCKELRNKINSVAKVDYMKCSGSSGKANTKLTIHSNMSKDNIANMNKGLKLAYPELKFNCPTSIYNP